MFILPFDHRAGLERELFGYDPAHLGERDRANIRVAKEIIFQAFRKAKPQLKGQGMILVDEEFGSAILDRAQKEKIPYIVTTEKSGVSDFEFIHGASFSKLLAKRKPAFAKALVHYSTLSNAGKARLKELSDWCAAHKIPLLLEPLLGKEQPSPKLMIAMMNELHVAGIHPSLWKVEGLKQSGDWKKVRNAACAPIVVLGRASSKKMVNDWLKAAAESGQVDGFAIGRTIFMEPLKKYFAKKITKQEAVAAMAKSLLGFVSLWERSIKKIKK